MTRRAADEERSLARGSLWRLRVDDRRARRVVARPSRRRRLRLRRLAFRDRAARALYVGVWAATRGSCRRGARTRPPPIVPFQNFATADGWFVVAARSRSSGCAVRGARAVRELATDERFATSAGARDNRDELLTDLDGRSRSGRRPSGSSRWPRPACRVAGERHRRRARGSAGACARRDRRGRASGARNSAAGGAPRFGWRTHARPVRRAPSFGASTRSRCSARCVATRANASMLSGPGVFGDVEVA